MKVKVYVEGSGDSRADQEPLRRAFRTLIENCDFKGRMPAFIGCGGREEAFDIFKNHLSNPEKDTIYLLLVDSEDLVSASSPWEHLRTRVGDGWLRPKNAIDEQVHFMATCTEAWLIADRDNLKKYFGKGFRENALGSQFNLENRPRDILKKALENASKDCQTKFTKGAVCFEILETTSPDKLKSLSYFRRFIETLETLKSTQS